MCGLPAATSVVPVDAALRETLLGDVTAWAKHVLAPFEQKPAWHHEVLLTALGDLAAGSCDRLMVLMPPGSAKSTYASVLFPAWWLARRPRGAVIAASHTGGLARSFGSQVRGLLREHGALLGCGMSRSEAAAGQFRTESGASYYAVGVRGPVTGRRADLLLIDDPIRSQAEADSADARERIWAWYRADLSTRLKPKGAVVLVMTRWHPDDLAGRLLAAGDSWRVLQLPALAEVDDPMGRKLGDALWPESEDVVALARKRGIVGERAWAALFQQRPTIALGGLFTPSRLPVLEHTPEVISVVRAWDLAASAGSEGDPDWTVGLKLGRTAGGQFVVLDVVRVRLGPGDVVAEIRRTAAMDGRGVTISLPQDPGQAGKAQVRFLTSELAGYQVVSSTESGPKDVRARPVAAQADVGNLAIVRAAWNGALLDEIGSFPNGSKDDQVDALARAFDQLSSAVTTTRRVSVPVFAR
jgi:predicted phage terminase large subunit-like protein